MTGRDLVTLAGSNPGALGVALAGIPVLTFVIGLTHRKGNGARAPWKFLYALIVYVVCVPGVFSALLTAYAMFFARENLLNLDVIVFLGPIVCMVATLLLMRRNVAFEDVPGFDRISGLMTMLGVTFLILLMLDRMRIWVVFGGSIAMLIAIGAFVFALLKWGTYMAFRGSSEPKRPPPTLGLG